MQPGQRKTRSQGGLRRSHQHAKVAAAVFCPDCRSVKRPHAACPNCGYVRPGLKLALGKDK